MSSEADSRSTADALIPFLYADLRRMARHARWQVSAGSTVQTTALVHEAYLKLRRSEGFESRQHFMRSAAIAMRHILVNVARESVAQKRGGPDSALPLDEEEALQIAGPDAGALVEVDEIMERLRELNGRLADVVECRFFAGYSEQETAEVLGVSDRTVRRDWLKARAWLRRELSDGAPLERVQR